MPPVPRHDPELSATQKVDRRDLDSLTETGRHSFGTVGPYRLKRILGKGGTAIVYLAQKEDSPEIALKVFNDSPETDRVAFARFLRESQAVSRLRDHPNVITVYDTGEADGSYYIAMELVPDGRTLKDLLFEQGPLDRHQALDMGIAIAKALSYAHRLGYVHRDIKPQNVLINEFGVPLLSDFGLVRAGISNLTEVGELLGTPIYMAPEQLQYGSRDAAPLTDIYGLGITLYEMLLGSLPYGLKKGMEYKAILEQVQTADPLTLSPSGKRFGRDLEGILGKLLERNPVDRYQSAEAVVKDLQTCRAGRALGLRLPSWSDRFEAWVQKHRISTLSILIAVLGLGLLALYYFEQGEEKLSQGVVDDANRLTDSRQLGRELEALSDPYSDADKKTSSEPMYQAWDQARRALREGRIEEGREHYTRALDLAREQGDRQIVYMARAALARIMIAKGNYEEAQAEMFAVAASQPHHTLLWELCIFEAGVSSWLQDERAGAKRSWEILLPESRQTVESLYQRSYISILSEYMLGQQDSDTVLTSLETVPAPFQGLGYWCLAQKTDDPEQKQNWLNQARRTGGSHFVWIPKEIEE